MKKINSCLFIAVMLLFVACNNRDENGSTDTSNTNASHSVTDSTRGDKPSETMPVTASSPATPESIEFANKAAAGGMMEVEAGKLAQQNGMNPRVKDFGGMMVADHSQANDELKNLAAAGNITLPSALPADLQKHIEMLSKLKGEAFDKQYMAMMVDDHKEDIGEFKKEANASADDAFKAFAAKTLPTLLKHLDSAQAIHGK